MKVEGHGVAVTYEVTTLLDAEESGSGTRSAWLWWIGAVPRSHIHSPDGSPNSHSDVCMNAEPAKCLTSRPCKERSVDFSVLHPIQNVRFFFAKNLFLLSHSPTLSLLFPTWTPLDVTSFSLSESRWHHSSQKETRFHLSHWILNYLPQRRPPEHPTEIKTRDVTHPS